MIDLERQEDEAYERLLERIRGNVKLCEQLQTSPMAWGISASRPF